MNRQYIGARYVPKFFNNDGSNDWVSGIPYEALVIVTDLNNSYTSCKPVPSNIGRPSQNPDYWVCSGNYNAQVEEYRQATLALADDVEDIGKEVDALKNYATPQMYGAKGDGVTDDYQAFVDCLAENNLIFIPNGEYHLSNALEITKDGVRIIGEHYVTTKLMCDKDGVTIISSRNIELENFSIWSNESGYSGLVLNGTHAVHVSYVYVYNSDKGIELRTTFSWDDVFTEVRINDCGTGLYIPNLNAMNTLYFNYCIFSDCNKAIDVTQLNGYFLGCRFSIIAKESVLFKGSCDCMHIKSDFECDETVNDGWCMKLSSNYHIFEDCKFLNSGTDNVNPFIKCDGVYGITFNGGRCGSNITNFIDVSDASNVGGYGKIVFNSTDLNPIYDGIISGGSAGDVLKVRNLKYGNFVSKNGNTYNTQYLKEGEIVVDHILHKIYFFDGTALKEISAS